LHKHLAGGDIKVPVIETIRTILSITGIQNPGVVRAIIPQYFLAFAFGIPFHAPRLSKIKKTPSLLWLIQVAIAVQIWHSFL